MNDPGRLNSTRVMYQSLQACEFFHKRYFGGRLTFLPAIQFGMSLADLITHLGESEASNWAKQSAQIQKQLSQIQRMEYRTRRSFGLAVPCADS